MAVSTRFLEQGQRNAVLQLDVTAEVGGNNATILVANFTPPCSRVSIRKIQWSIGGVVGGEVLLEWDATIDDVAWRMPTASSDTADFSAAGGLQNPMSGGATGNLNLVVPADTPASIVLWMKKKYD